MYMIWSVIGEKARKISYDKGRKKQRHCLAYRTTILHNFLSDYENNDSTY